MSIDTLKQLEQQVQALMDYSMRLKQENAKLHERNRLISDKLQNLAAQLKSLEDNGG